MGRKKKILPNFMDVVFVPNPGQAWKEREDGNVVVDMENKGFYHWIAQKFFHRPRISHIALDAYGTALWKGLDGTRTVYEVVQLMEAQFPEEREQMLNRVVTFLRTLQMNHFIMDQSKIDNRKEGK